MITLKRNISTAEKIMSLFLLLQVTAEGRTVDFSTSSGLSDPVFEAQINGNNVLLQVRIHVYLELKGTNMCL